MDDDAVEAQAAASLRDATGRSNRIAVSHERGRGPRRTGFREAPTEDLQ